MDQIKIFVLTMLVCVAAVSVSAVGDYAADSVYDGDMDVHESSWWERLSSKLEIGTYDSSGRFTTTFFVGDTVTAKFDETTWNVQCGSAKFVVEIYSPTGFDSAKYYWAGPVSGNKHFAGTITHGLPDKPGTWTYVDYLYCVDSGSSSYNKVISSSNKISVSVLSKTEAQTCSAGYVGPTICSDGDAKRSYRSTDCSTTLRTVQDCSGSQHCFDGACEDPECSRASDCDPWQECLSGECVATDASVKAYEDEQKSGGGSGSTDPGDAGSGSTGSGSSTNGDVGGSTGAGGNKGGEGSGDHGGEGVDLNSWFLWGGVLVAIGGAALLLVGVGPVGVVVMVIGIVAALLGSTAAF